MSMIIPALHVISIYFIYDKVVTPYIEMWKIDSLSVLGLNLISLYMKMEEGQLGKLR